MRIAIVGPGAMGILVSCYLTTKGHVVTVFDRDRERAGRLAEKGLIFLKGEVETRVTPAVLHDSRAKPLHDLAIITVKAAQTEEAAATAARALLPDGVALTLQNGLGGADILAGTAGAKRVLVGTTSQGATLLGEGVARHGGSGPTIIGPCSPGTPSRPEVVELLNAAGLEARWEEDIYRFVWKKLAANCGINAITALTGQKNIIIAQNTFARQLCAEAVRETALVAAAVGLDLGDPDQLVAWVLGVAEATGVNRSSMGQDFDRRRPTEVEFINMAVVSYGEKYGIATPVNRTLAGLIKCVDSTRADKTGE